ncbi:hypothetical protein BDV32DRAFT_130611 [Aspergillus pseudonomiae]|uniref:Uncharacterized protein n=1 Tax=Aspergillus pseudonomiae TaxID=1506151 RepID=A0A5N6HML0_9EURO|nr:uncharacterized protein BDV37DRAFT_239816 [Aspergillus pseudonomiae]KAB8255535.1 hypothetical protein BDV32DRAFT_130611 [Aspergillus pseudonomiae]KAE8408049.1 hypothetical protein BDV37DRAFT_239816 [Aspergillus pseudonomiae]
MSIVWASGRLRPGSLLGLTSFVLVSDSCFYYIRQCANMIDWFGRVRVFVLSWAFGLGDFMVAGFGGLV